MMLYIFTKFHQKLFKGFEAYSGHETLAVTCDLVLHLAGFRSSAHHLDMAVTEHLTKVSQNYENTPIQIY